MTSLKQLEANRRSALRSTGPRSLAGKLRSRANAYRHGLTAETVVVGVEDVEDYEAFQLAITSEYGAETAVARELVLRLASALWRLRRASAFETALLDAMMMSPTPDVSIMAPKVSIAACVLKLMEHPTHALDRLSRYEHALWRQTRQLILTLRSMQHHAGRPRRPSRSAEDLESRFESRDREASDIFES